MKYGTKYVLLLDRKVTENCERKNLRKTHDLD